MSKYLFTVDLKNTEIPEPVFIECDAPDWREPVLSEKFIGIFTPLVTEYLSHAFCMFGQLFNVKRHSPQKLYEALISNDAWEITVDGVDCELPERLIFYDELPTGSIG